MPSALPRLALVAAVLTVAVACQDAGAGKPTTKAPEPGASTQPAVARDMLRHDEIAEKSRAALISGDLEAFRLGMEIAAVQPLPGALAEHASTFVARARVGAEAKDLGAAAAALGQVGAACGTCHLARPGERYPASGFEEGDDSLLDRMQRHWWATDALWQGLVTPNDTAWTTGATTLADRSLTRVSGFPDTPEAKARAEALQAAARTAMQATTPDTRGEAFGAIVATCADCHTALGRGPVVSEP